MSPILIAGSGAIVSYLLGAIPFGLLVALARGVDIRQVGSGNIGATNVFRCVGKGWGVLTFAADALKGFAASFLVARLAAGFAGGGYLHELTLLYACLAVVGHNWPVFLRFKGGKGVATTVGALLGVAPLAMLVGLLAWLAAFISTRYVSVASLAAALVVPLFAWFTRNPGEPLLPGALTVLAALIVIRHTSNIRRLLNGTESRFARRKSS